MRTMMIHDNDDDGDAESDDVIAIDERIVSCRVAQESVCVRRTYVRSHRSNLRRLASWPFHVERIGWSSWTGFSPLA